MPAGCSLSKPEQPGLYLQEAEEETEEAGGEMPLDEVELLKLAARRRFDEAEEDGGGQETVV